MIKLDYRKKSQYILINNERVYVWLYKKENYIAYGINGTSFHRVLMNYKDYENKDIIYMIKKEIENASF